MAKQTSSKILIGVRLTTHLMHSLLMALECSLCIKFMYMYIHGSH